MGRIILCSTGLSSLMSFISVSVINISKHRDLNVDKNKNNNFASLFLLCRLFGLPIFSLLILFKF